MAIEDTAKAPTDAVAKQAEIISADSMERSFMEFPQEK
jgi:hypothetical protein